MTSCHCCATDQQFDSAVARRDLRRFRRRGPAASTRQVLAAVQACPLPPRPTLLDIGGGIGAIHHVLLEHGFDRATHVDASAAYLAAAAEEAGRLGHTGRVQFQLANFPAVAATLPRADVVTLDRVVCCDPDYVHMLGAAADHARRLVAFSYPRPRWVIRLFIATANAARRLVGHSFRAYVHPPTGMTAVLEEAGMRRSWAGGSWVLGVQLFERAA